MKTKKPKGKNKKKTSRKKSSPAQTINSVFIEIPAFAIREGIHDIVEAFQHRMIIQMFGQDNIDVIVNSIENCQKLKDILQNKLTEYHQALGLLDFEEVHDYIFFNTKRKKDAGLVFIPMKSAKWVAKEFIRIFEIPSNYNGFIGLINALSGSMAFCLQELLPNAKIVCQEEFPYYKNHLNSIGFKTYNKKQMEKKKMIKIKYWFLNPPYQKDAGGENDIKNKQGSWWFNFVEDAVMSPVSTDDAKYYVVSPKSMFGSGRYGMKSSKINRIHKMGARIGHIWPDLNWAFKGIVSQEICGYTIEKGKTDSTVTIEDSTETIVLDEKYPVPFLVSPLAFRIVSQTWSQFPVISFEDTLSKQDDNVAVLRVSGGPRKAWNKTFVGYEKDTVNNKNGAVILETEIPGYSSGIKSQLWKYIWNIFGGNNQSPTTFMKHMPIMEICLS